MFQAIKPLLAFIALVGMTLSLVVHVAALLGINASVRYPWVWGLHLGIFVVFVPALYSSKGDFNRQPRLTFSELREGVPDWLVVFGAALFLYAFVNFALFMVASQGGVPAENAGHFVLENHGKFIRDITAAEYAAMKTNDLRGFSGHWMVFYFVSFAMLKFRKAAR